MTQEKEHDGLPEENHPYIIKMPEDAPASPHGIGYEVFHGMKKYPENISQYVAETGESYTFAELLDYTIRVALNMQKLGLADDDIISFCLGNHKYSVMPYLATLFLGRIVAALDPGIIPAEKAALFQTVPPKIIFVDEKYLKSVEEALKIANMDIKLIVIGANAGKHLSFDEFLKASEEDVANFEPVKLSTNERTAMIFFSSGSTGKPKGICLSHYAVTKRTQGDALATQFVFSQLNWVSYTTIVLRCLRYGSTRVLMEGFDVEKVIDAFYKYDVVGMLISIFQVAEFVRHPKTKDFTKPFYVLTGGSALPHEVLVEFRQRFPQGAILVGYGMTELSGPLIMYDMTQPQNWKWQLEKVNCCGKPVSDIWYKVVDPETDEILGPNKPGELRVKSKFLFLGYYNMDSSEAYDSNGWFKTGDIVKYDEDKCFYIVDRIKEMIKYRCWVISPTTIELVLMSHPAVDKAAVVGIPQGTEGDYPMGIVTLKKNCKATPEQLTKYVSERVLDRQKLRAGVKIVDELPLLGNDKVKKGVLRKMVLNGEI